MPQVAIKTGSNIVRVISTYRVKSNNVGEAREIVKKFFKKQSMPSDIKLVGKTEVVTLRGLL